METKIEEKLVIEDLKDVFRLREKTKRDYKNGLYATQKEMREYLKVRENFLEEYKEFIFSPGVKHFKDYSLTVQVNSNVGTFLTGDYEKQYDEQVKKYNKIVNDYMMDDKEKVKQLKIERVALAKIKRQAIKKGAVEKYFLPFKFW